MKKHGNSKQMLFEMMEKVNPDFKLNENVAKLKEGYGRSYKPYNNWDKAKYRSWSKEKNAGDPDAADPNGYYEVENGQFVDASDYDKWEHGTIINRYNRAGKKVDADGYEIE